MNTTKTKPKLRHIALSVDDPFATAEFYMKAFAMDKVGETDSPLARGVYLSDGVMNLAILAFKNDYWAGTGGKAYRGIHHFGFQIDNIQELEEVLYSAGGKDFTGRPTEGNTSTVMFEKKYYDPNGIMVEAAITGWPTSNRTGEES
jgi:catechol 2,3-dioxygenase-like lactoylglutathione lyase family enzyme